MVLRASVPTTVFAHAICSLMRSTTAGHSRRGGRRGRAPPPPAPPSAGEEDRGEALSAAAAGALHARTASATASHRIVERGTVTERILSAQKSMRPVALSE